MQEALIERAVLTYFDNKKESLGDRMRRKAFTAPGMPLPMSSQTNLPAQEATNISAEAVEALSGDLSSKPIPWLLMTAQHYEVTGRMQIGLAACPVVIQFGLGRPVHAQSPFCTGTEAIMDLFIWKDGKVRFEHGPQPETVSVQESLEELIGRGEEYAFNKSFLEDNAISEMSFLMRPRQPIINIEQRLAKGQSISPSLQLEFYSNIYGTRNIKDTAEKLCLTPSQWVSISANLLQLGILLAPDGRSIAIEDDADSTNASGNGAVGIGNGSGVVGGSNGIGNGAGKLSEEFLSLQLPQNNTPKVEPLNSLWQTKTSVPRMSDIPQEVTITPATMAKTGLTGHIVMLDAADHNRVLSLLSSPDSGIFTFDALQFFLAREYARACRFKSLLTLMLFSIRGANGQPVSPEVATLVTATVSRIKRDVDVFGHFGSRAYALLLPNVDSNQACLLVDRINRDLVQITPDLKEFQVSLHFGLASVPQDSSELNGLVKSAQVAMFHATSNQTLRTMAQQLRQ